MLSTFSNRYENYNSSLPCFKPMCEGCPNRLICANSTSNHNSGITCNSDRSTSDRKMFTGCSKSCSNEV